MPTLLFGSLPRRPLLLVALLMATLLAVLPAVVSAQGPPPQPPKLAWGANDAVTVGGAPWDGSQIDVINEAGVVVATVKREGDSWSVEIPRDVDAFRFRASNGGVSEVYRLDPGASLQVHRLVIGDPSSEDLTREVALLTGWNWVVWTGQTQSIANALATFPDTSQLSAIFEYVGGPTDWGSYRPGLPAFVQSIDELRSGAAYFLLVDSALTWTIPADGEMTGTRTIAAGFTAIGWVGPDATPQGVLDAVANPAAIAALFRFNASTQKYESYRTNVPAFVNRNFPSSIQPFEVLFISATAQTTITQ
jgi:hypothetical protein